MTLLRTTICFSLLLLAGSLLWGADKAKKKGPDYSGQDLPQKSFSNQQLENANFEDAVCKSARFDRANLMGANFQGADLSYASFANSDLTNADFREAQLSYTSFYSATMNGANLRKCDLSMNGGLSYVKLRKADLRNLKAIGMVTEVDFSEADLRGANLVGMKLIATSNRFRKAKYDSKTRWPKGFDVEASGAILVEEEEKDGDEDDAPKPEPEKNEKGAKDPEAEFLKLDVNEDGRLTGKEMKGLEELDKNKDGRITLEEFVAGRK